jgi:hypothetical protein
MPLYENQNIKEDIFMEKILMFIDIALLAMVTFAGVRLIIKGVNKYGEKKYGGFWH